MSTLTPFRLARALRTPAQKMSRAMGFKTRLRPFSFPLNEVLAEIPQGTRLYDIGCGNGALLYLALKFRSVNIAYGCDVSAGAVRASSAFGVDPKVFRVSLLHPDDTPPVLTGYITICMIDVLHHLPRSRQDGFIHDVVDRMDPGATLIFKDIDGAKRAGAFCNRIHDRLLSGQWVHARRSNEIVEMLQSLGLHVRSVVFQWTLCYPHFQVVATKP